MRSVFFFSLILGVSQIATSAALPVVSNVSAQQRDGTKFVDISYDVEDADGDLLNIRVEVSDDAGTTFSVPAFSLTGDFGSNVEPGLGKSIVWDAGIDWDGEYSEQMQVKVIATDGQGLPGLEWSNEVPSGGFLLGKDGGPEGSGPSRHVNIPWSYWLSKYEITNEQYAEFLNAAYASGKVTRVEEEVYSNPSEYAYTPGLGARKRTLTTVGDDFGLRWNVNKFDTVAGEENLPVSATFYGAIAFADFYGYDIPTEAEWEKAARGPLNGDQGEHQIFPWGNEISNSHGNFYQSGDPYDGLGPNNLYRGKTPVGYYDGNQIPSGIDTVNSFGLYDLVGNVSEWTRSSPYSIETYPQTEDLEHPSNQIITPNSVSAYEYVVKGGSFWRWNNVGNSLKDNDFGSEANRLYFRQVFQGEASVRYIGFRVIRRDVE